jgi:hypothetical protein
LSLQAANYKISARDPTGLPLHCVFSTSVAATSDLWA